MSAALLVQTRKEVRALLPWTIGVAIACVALATLAGRNAYAGGYREPSPVFFVVAYAFGALAVSALSIGQEITHGTLAALLVQPVERFRILVLKLALLTIALAGLAFMAGALFPQTAFPDVPDLRRLLIWGPVAAGIGLAPLLTVLTRRPLGGVVFSPTIPGVILVVAEKFYPLHLGSEAWSIAWYGTIIVSAAGLAILILKFRTLEVAGDGLVRAAVPAASRPDANALASTLTVRRPWLWLVIKKELRLQQMTFAVSGLYVVAAVAVMLAAQDQAYMGPTFGAISIIHAYFIPLIAGSVASAEERQMGTLAGQILQPRNARLQWAIKSILTIGLALVLAFGLPVLLMSIHRPLDPFRVQKPEFVLLVGMICLGAMWVSSISANTLWALLVCFPVVGLAGLIGGFGYSVLQSRVRWPARHWRDGLSYDLYHQLFQLKSWRVDVRQASTDIETSLHIIQISLIASFGLLVLAFAARNHRTLDRSVRRAGAQLLAILLYAAVAATGYVVIERIAWNWMPY